MARRSLIVFDVFAAWLANDDLGIDCFAFSIISARFGEIRRLRRRSEVKFYGGRQVRLFGRCLTCRTRMRERIIEQLQFLQTLHGQVRFQSKADNYFRLPKCKKDFETLRAEEGG